MVKTVREWAAELEEMHGRIAHRFARSEPRKRALSYLKGLTGSVERKNGWRLAEATGERTTERRFQGEAARMLRSGQL